MKIIANYKKIERNKKIGQYTSLAAMVILMGGFVIAISQIIGQFQSKDANQIVNEQMLTYSYIAMFVGLILTQISLYFGNRWGKKPTIDESISQGLKGLDDRYVLYHYMTAVPHLLLGPAGIWVLSPMYQAGSITYVKNRYQQQGISFFNRLFGQEGIGRPEQEAAVNIDEFNKFLKKNMADQKLPPVQSAIIFTNPRSSVQVNDTPYPTMTVDKLKDFVRRKAKEQPVNPSVLTPLISILPDEDA